MQERSPSTVAIIDTSQSTYLADLSIETEVLGHDATPILLHVDVASELGSDFEQADVVISWHHVGLDREALSRLRKCRGIVRAGVGIDNVDCAYAASIGLPVANVPDYGTEEVADHAMGLFMHLVRQIGKADG